MAFQIEPIQISIGGESYPGLDVLRVLAAFGVIFLHVYVTIGQPSSLYWLLKLRDFSLPVMVMASFFLLTASLSRKTEYNFSEFLGQRMKRLLLPMIVWTAIFSLAVAFLLPRAFALNSGGLPPAIVFLTGYRHLWYLQFLFLGSLTAYPLLFWLTSRGRDRESSSLRLFGFLLLGAALLYTGLLLFPAWEVLDPKTDPSVRIFLSQSTAYLPLIPVAVALGLSRQKIGELFAGASFRLISWVLVGVAAVLHTLVDDMPLTREAFACALFVAALQPRNAKRIRMLGPFVRNSYGIYILHFLPVQIVWILVSHKEYNFEAGAALVLTAGIFAVCFAVTSILTRLPASEWFMPTIHSSLHPQTVSREERSVILAESPLPRIAV